MSTRLFLGERLDELHIRQIAAHGFKAIEAVACRSHFDYRNATAVARLGAWLSDADVALHSVHAPVDASLASGDETVRARAVDEVAAALEVARTVPYQYLVLQLGSPAAAAGAGDNQPAAARRSLERIVETAAGVHVGVAVEVIDNKLSSPAALVRLIEEDLDELDFGICLDYGHAHALGDLAESIEAVAGHLFTTHVHDNRGRGDDHLPPYDGSIDWDAAMMETQKIGYEGRLVLEVTARGNPADTLSRCAAACERLLQAFAPF
jgi:sugar phosphate isomerase/epimerase